MSSYWARFLRGTKKPDTGSKFQKPSQSLTAYLLPMRWKGQNMTVVSLLDKNSEHSIGPAIVGSLIRSIEEGGTVTSENFVANEEFVAFMHEVIERRGPEIAELQTAARSQDKGWLYIVDARTHDPGGCVPPEDIIGALEVEAGVIRPESYRRKSESCDLVPGRIVPARKTLS